MSLAQHRDDGREDRGAAGRPAAAHEAAQEPADRADAGRRRCDRDRHRHDPRGDRDGQRGHRRHPDRERGRGAGQGGRRSQRSPARRASPSQWTRPPTSTSSRPRPRGRKYDRRARRGRRRHGPLRRALEGGGARGRAPCTRAARHRVARRDGLRGSLHAGARPRDPRPEAGQGDERPARGRRPPGGRRHRLRDHLRAAAPAPTT